MAKPLTEVPRAGPEELKVAPKREPAEESTKVMRLPEPSGEPRETQYFALSPKKPTAAEAQPLDVLARKRRDVPPARPEVPLSMQGRPGALRSLCRARHPSDTMHWLVSEGEYKDVLINLRRPHCLLPMDRRPARGYNARAAPRRDT